MKKSKRLIKKAFKKISAFFTVTATTVMFAVVRASADTPAATDTDGKAAWDNVIGFLVPWIGRLGGAVMLIGGIMFGLAFKNDDADGKTRALQTLIAGAIVVAVGAASNIFLK